MKITFFIGSVYGGGAERVTCNLATYLAGKGHQIEILTISEIKESYELDEKVKVVPLLSLKERRNNFIDVLVRFPRFWKYLLGKQIDAYVVMLPATTIMMLAFRWMTKAKVIAAERVDPASYSKRRAWLLKKLAKRADGWVFQTEDAKAWYGDAVKNCKTAVIPNAINPVFIRDPYKGEKRKVIAGAGRLKDQKNFPLLIHAFAKIAEELPEYNLVIYGEGEKRKDLEGLVKQLNLEGRIDLPGNLKNIADEMERNSLFILSSDFEGMPNALMEAMALGLPCISTDCPCGGPRYLIKDGEDGLLVPIRDVNKIADAIRLLIENPQIREKIGHNAEYIRERLSPNKIYGEWEKFINEVR